MTRDPIRKLGWEDRLIGASKAMMDGLSPSSAEEQELPQRAHIYLLPPKDLLNKIWSQEAPKEEINQIAKLLIG